jgi:hypothetical protein
MIHLCHGLVFQMMSMKQELPKILNLLQLDRHCHPVEIQ